MEKVYVGEFIELFEELIVRKTLSQWSQLFISEIQKRR